MTDQSKPSEIKHDDKPTESDKPTLEQRRVAAEAAAKAKVASHALPSGYMVRADGDDSRARIVQHVMEAGAAVDPNPDRTELTRAAYKVADAMRGDADPVPAKLSPETATRLMNAVAGLTEAAGLSRKDEDLKDTVINQGADDKGKRKDDDNAGKRRRKDDDDEETGEKRDQEEDAATLADVVKLLGEMNERIDRIEGKGRRDDEEPDPVLGEEDEPRDLAADDAHARRGALRKRTAVERADSAVCDWRNEDRFATFQSRVDSVASLWGHKADRPMAGETLGGFKRRSVRHWQSLSPTYKDADLKVLQVADGVAFNVAVDDILKCADAEGRAPTRVAAGHLAPRVEQKGGHTITKFYGRPSTWMNTFAPRGQVVKRINRLDSSGNVTGAIYQRG
jgi:hypothetical protein